MRGPTWHRLATWLCLWAALFASVLPHRDLVLCVGPEGTLAIEVGADAGGACDCCSEAFERSGAQPGVTAGGCCQCTDIAIASPGDPPVKPERSGTSVERPAVVSMAETPVVRPMDREPWICSAPPKPPPGLARIRTVVLRI